MNNVMIDLETLGVRPGGVVLSIGAAHFDVTGVRGTYYQVIQRDSAVAAGFVEDRHTLAWWYRQPGGVAFLSLCADNGPTTMPLGDALVALRVWLEQVGSIKDLRVWGNGADFDLPILAEAYARCGMNTPWSPYAGRCYRTLKNLRPGIAINRKGHHHNAEDDARDQAEHAVRLLNAMEGWE